MIDFLHKASKNRAFLMSASAILMLLLVALLIEPFLPFDPYQEDFTAMLAAPGGDHLFGTDAIGRDVFSRTLAGAKYSLLATFLMVVTTTVIGTVLGMIAGFFGGAIDTFIMRLTEVLLSLPTMVCAVAVIALIGPGLINVVLIVSLLWWTRYARMTRNLVIQIRSKEYITEAILGGENNARLIFNYILPNILPEVIVMSTLDIGKMLLTIAGMSFLGLSVQPPTPEWGFMLSEGKRYLANAPWMTLCPGIAIFITVLLFNVLGESIRDILDPKFVNKN